MPRRPAVSSFRCGHSPVPEPRKGRSCRRISLLNCEIDRLTLRETVDEIDRLVRSRTPVRHSFVNAHVAVMLDRNTRLRQLVNSSALVNADGQSIVWSARLLGQPLPERVAGPDLFEAGAQAG